MKYLNIFCVLLVFSLALLTSCNSDSSDARDQARENLVVPESPATDPTSPIQTAPTPPAAEPAQNAEGVWHWTCSKGCAGGGGGAGSCATCGGPLAHNAAYHNSSNAASTPTVPGAMPTIPGATTTAVPPPTAKPAEPAQNAAGVWHYTCSKGCAGGAGSAVACAGCGGTLAHNASYHN